jgi:AcrR family transcriptional regulator
MPLSAHPAVASDSDRRRQAVLESAMATFARFGYRKTSMDDVAKAAHISRPGLYFLFDSKPNLFREAVTHVLGRDLDLIAGDLSDQGRPLEERLIRAFERWGGSYVGPLTDDMLALPDDTPALLGEVGEEAPRRFEELVTRAIADADPGRNASAIAQTLISASIGIKHQVDTAEAYLLRLTTAVGVILNG